jgi:O-antigen ligase
MIALITGPLMLASLVPIGLSAEADPESAVMGLMKHGGKEATQEADLRLETWQKAVGRTLESGMLGLGPGPHLPIPWSLLAARATEADPENNPHPAPNGTQNFEAHNTVLDLFTQGGFIAVASLVWLIATAFAIVHRARLPGLAALLCGLCVVGMTGLIIREPIFWFAIAVSLTAEGANLLPARYRFSPAGSR